MAKKGESLADDGRDGVARRISGAADARTRTRSSRNRATIGLAKELPVSEMEKLILANTRVGDEDVRLLGQPSAPRRSRAGCSTRGRCRRSGSSCCPPMRATTANNPRPGSAGSISPALREDAMHPELFDESRRAAALAELPGWAPLPGGRAIGRPSALPTSTPPSAGWAGWR